MLLAGTFVDHDPVPGKTGDAAGFKAGVADLRASFPDFACAIEDVLVSGGRVAVRGVCTGTQQGPFFGAAASGRAFRAGFIEVVRISDGRITERWGQRDTMKMLDQLGFSVKPGIPVAAPAPAAALTATETGKPAEKPKEKKAGWF
jgi:predicted ester cyclase